MHRERIYGLSLDYDPDVSFANIENRLQMLILTAHENVRRRSGAAVLSTGFSN